MPRLRTALLNDAERARACSQIGPSWLRKHESTTLKTPISILNQGILPPLDFLELAEDSQEEDKEGNNKEEKNKEVKKVIGEVKPEVEFLFDNKNKTVQEKEIINDKETIKEILVDNSNKEVKNKVDKAPEPKKTKGKNKISSTSAPTTTKVESTTVKPAISSKPSTVKPTTTPKSSPTTKRTKITTTAKPVKSPVQKLEKKIEKELLAQKSEKVDKEVPSAQRIFAVPVFRPPTESEDIKDVFDMSDDERKNFQSSTPTTKNPPFTRRITASTTRKPTTPRSTTTRKVSTTTVTTTPQSTTTKRRPVFTRRTSVATTSSPTSTRETTTARPSSTRKITTRTTRLTTTRQTTTTPITTTEKQVTTTTRPRTTTRSRFTRPPTFRVNGKCPMDLLLLVDSSGSVQNIYDQQKEFLKQILQETNLQEEVHRVSLLQFAGSAIQKTEWSFDAFSRNSDLMKALERVRLITGTTYIGAALENSLQLLENRRRNVPTIVILVSDGFSQDDATQPAEQIRKLDNLEFYSLSIAELTNRLVTKFKIKLYIFSATTLLNSLVIQITFSLEKMLTS